MKLLKDITLVAVVLVLTAGAAYAGNTQKKPTDADLKTSLEHQTKGNVLDEQGNSKDAIEEYKAALNYNPNDTNTLFNMGTVYLKINRPEDAAKALEALLKIDNKDTEAYNLLGLAYRGCGKKDNAIKAWEKSLSLDPKQNMPKKFIEEAKNL